MSMIERAEHICPHPDCTKTVPDEMFACSQHWYGLPKDIRNAIWAGYRQHGVGSRQLREAHERARVWWEPHLRT
jgi:hypothetical protein